MNKQDILLDAIDFTNLDRPDVAIYYGLSDMVTDYLTLKTANDDEKWIII